MDTCLALIVGREEYQPWRVALFRERRFFVVPVAGERIAAQLIAPCRAMPLVLHNRDAKRMEPEANGTEASLRQPLIDMAVESWRFGKLFGRVLGKLDAGEAPRYANQLRYFLKRLDESLESAGIRIVDLDGQPYDPGMAASPLNIADFAADDILVVDQMVEPVLMGRDGLVKAGTIMLRRQNNQ